MTGRHTDHALPDWLVRNRNFVLLWAAYGISAVGDHLSEMALLVERHALEGEHATRIQALITFGFFIPFVVLGPLAGWWADRFSRKWTMIGTDILRAGVMGSLIWTVAPLVRWLEPHGHGDHAIVIPLVVTGALAAFFSPSRQALLPTLIRPDQLVRANAMISALGTIGTIVSAVLGGFIVQHLGKQWNYSLDALTFLASAALLSWINMARTRAVPHPTLTGVWSPLRDGFRYVLQHRRALDMILLGTVFWAAAGIVISVVPALVRDVFGGDIVQTGLYRGLLGIGLASGAALMTIFGPAMPIPLAVLLALSSGTFWLFALALVCGLKVGPVAAGVSLVCIGASGAGLLVTVMAALQRFVPDSHRGRVFGVSDMCTMAAIVAATGALALPNIPSIDLYVPWLLGVGGLMLAVALWRAWHGYRQRDPYPAVLSVLWKMALFYARYWLGVQRVGPCTVPRSGPVILAANHTSGVDPIGILTTCTHRVTSFLVEEQYYRRPIAGWLQRLIGCIPVKRASPGKSSLTACLELLERGGCLGIFPEGTYAAPGEESPEPKLGVGLLALRSGAVVIPCHISGTVHDDRPLGAYWHQQRMRVRYGPPVDLSQWRGRAQGRGAAQQATELIMSKIHELGTRARTRSV